MEYPGPANPAPAFPNQASMSLVTVYGTSWCTATQVVRRHLVRLGVRYRYGALDQSPHTLTQLMRVASDSAVHPSVRVKSGRAGLGAGPVGHALTSCGRRCRWRTPRVA